MNLSPVNTLAQHPIITTPSNGHPGNVRRRIPAAAEAPVTPTAPTAARVGAARPVERATLAPLERIAAPRRAALVARASGNASVGVDVSTPAVKAPVLLRGVNRSAPVGVKPTAATTTQELAPPAHTNPPRLTRDDIPRIESAFNTRVGDDRFDAALDLSGDGVINGMDISFILNAPDTAAPAVEPPAVEPSAVAPPPAESRSADVMTRAELVDGVLKAFGRSVGANDINSVYDLSGDGVINGLDLAFALNRDATAPKVSESGNGPTPSVRTITEAYGARQGQAGYARTLDLNGDGVVNGGDISWLLNRVTDTEA